MRTKFMERREKIEELDRYFVGAGRCGAALGKKTTSFRTVSPRLRPCSGRDRRETRPFRNEKTSSRPSRPYNKSRNWNCRPKR